MKRALAILLLATATASFWIYSVQFERVPAALTAAKNGIVQYRILHGHLPTDLAADLQPYLGTLKVRPAPWINECRINRRDYTYSSQTGELRLKPRRYLVSPVVSISLAGIFAACLVGVILQSIWRVVRTKEGVNWLAQRQGLGSAK